MWPESGNAGKCPFAGIGGRLLRGEEEEMTIDSQGLLRQGDVLLVPVTGVPDEGSRRSRAAPATCSPRGRRPGTRMSWRGGRGWWSGGAAALRGAGDEALPGGRAARAAVA